MVALLMLGECKTARAGVVHGAGVMMHSRRSLGFACAMQGHHMPLPAAGWQWGVAAQQSMQHAVMTGALLCLFWPAVIPLVGLQRMAEMVLLGWPNLQQLLSDRSDDEAVRCSTIDWAWQQGNREGAPVIDEVMSQRSLHDV